MGINRVSLVSILVVLAIVILLIVIYFYPAGENNEFASEGWRMIYGNPQGNCLSNYNTSHLTGKVIWNRSVGDTVTRLLVDRNERIYLLSKGKIISSNGDGKVLWESSINFSSIIPAIDEYSNIYAATADSQILSLNEDEDVRWTFPFPVSNERASAPFIVQNHTLYVLTTAGNFYILSYEGNLIAKVNLGNKTSLPPVVSSNGEGYVGVNNSVYVLTSMGKVMKKIDLKGEIIRMAIYGKELYITTLDVKFSPYPVVKNVTPYLFSISNEGKVNWKIDLNMLGAKWGIPSSLAVDENAIYGGIKPSALPSGEVENETQNHSFIMKFDKQGNLIWKRGFYRVINGVALSKDGLLYATFSRYSVMNDKHCKIYALNQNGEILWSASLGAYIGAPVIGPDNLYVYSGGSLYAMG